MSSKKSLRNHLASCEISLEMGTEIDLLVTIPFLLLGTEGDGLGKNRNGEVNPLTLDIKQDKRGLIASDEAVGKKGRAALQMTAVDLSGKVFLSSSIRVHFQIKQITSLLNILLKQNTA